MKVAMRKLPNGKIQLEALATVSEVSTAYDRGHQRFANQMGVQPNPGESIAKAVERKIGVKNLDSLVERFVLEYLAPFAIDKKNIEPEFIPEAVAMTRPARGKELAFHLEVTPKPVYELSSYEPVKITVPVAKEQEGEVQKTLSEIAEQFTEYVMDPSAEGAVAKGDFVKLKMSCKVAGKEIAALTADGRTYHVGEGFMPEGFDENVVGMKVGESRSFSFAAPTYDDNLNTITAMIQCEVEVLGKQVPRIPEITDEWVKRCMPMFNSRAEMVQAVEQQVADQHKADRDDLMNRLASEAIVDRFEGHISNEAYEHTRDMLIRNVQEGLRSQGTSFDEYIEQAGGKEQFNMMMLMEARQMLSQGYALDAVFRHAKLKLTSADIDAFCISVNPTSAKMVRKDMEDSGRGFALRESAARMKAARWLVEHAEITEVDEL